MSLKSEINETYITNCMFVCMLRNTLDVNIYAFKEIMT